MPNTMPIVTRPIRIMGLLRILSTETVTHTHKSVQKDEKEM